MFAKITSHKGFLILELTVNRSIPGKVVTNLDKPACPGNTVYDTKENLGISKEALDIMRSLKRAKNSFGDLDWSKDEAGRSIFGWLGQAKRLINPKDVCVSPAWRISDCVSIPNDVPSEVKQALHKLKVA